MKVSLTYGNIVYVVSSTQGHSVSKVLFPRARSCKAVFTV